MEPEPVGLSLPSIPTSGAVDEPAPSTMGGVLSAPDTSAAKTPAVRDDHKTIGTDGAFTSAPVRKRRHREPTPNEGEPSPHLEEPQDSRSELEDEEDGSESTIDCVPSPPDFVKQDLPISPSENLKSY